jgi:hypothetical protein
MAEAGRSRIFRVAIKVLIVVTIVVVAGLAIAQDQETVELRSEVAATDPGAADYLAALVAADLVTGNEYEVLVNGDQVFPAMLQAIDGARERVSFETYVYEKGQVANQFTDALERASEARRRRPRDRRRGRCEPDGGRPRRAPPRRRLAVVDFNPSQWHGLEG